MYLNQKLPLGTAAIGSFFGSAGSNGSSSSAAGVASFFFFVIGKEFKEGKFELLLSSRAISLIFFRDVTYITWPEQLGSD